MGFFGSMDQDQLARLNSATKYPSILTYHVMGERGRLTDELTVEFDFGEPVSLTEKIDGTNARIILAPLRFDSPILGSREELLYRVGDLIRNPAQGIVETLLPIVSPFGDAAGMGTNSSSITVIYGEVYGGKTSSNAKQYSGSRAHGFRVFDVASIDPDVLKMSREDIAAWRDGGGQEFLSVEHLRDLAGRIELPLVPEVFSASLLEAPPVCLGATLAWMEAALPRSFAGLDDGAGGRPAGLVVRSLDRKKIAKLRFEDYRRTLQHEEKMSRQRG